MAPRHTWTCTGCFSTPPLLFFFFFFLTLHQIYFWSIWERGMQDRIGPTVGNPISFSDDMCPIIRSSTQPQMIPSPPTSHHKQATAPILTGWSMTFPQRLLTYSIVSYTLITEALRSSAASVSHISSKRQYITHTDWGEVFFMRFLSVS